jgi:uncharacterized protein (TIGR00299 family) protein
MFLGALLDAFPEMQQPLLGILSSIPFAPPPSIEVRPWRDDLLAGSRLIVRDSALAKHGHTTWVDIQNLLQTIGLAPAIVQHATGIFQVLAKAEAQVHGTTEADVTFHEVGAVDSILDIVGSAFLIDALKIEGWSISSLPLGSGQVRSAHGLLPVPAPATALLLTGYLTHDDGIPGERITPTGAAILRYLGCLQEPQVLPRRLSRTGIGFGSKVLPGISNCLRALVFQPFAEPAAHRELLVIEFEVDDQTPEDLAVGLERLRSVPGVFDALQMPAFGKKGRIVSHIQLLASPAQTDAVIAGCFRETTTIGMRYRLERGATLPRRMTEVVVNSQPLRIKVVERPGVGTTAKADIDGAVAAGGHASRTRLRRTAEEQVLAGEKESCRND